jgi:DNA-binding GntR family transcriptional regulator
VTDPIAALGTATDEPSNAEPAAQAPPHTVEVVYRALREAILTGEFAQGAVLSQVQLARRFGVSRTPLREALRLLQGEGFIDSVPNRRVRVASVSVQDLEQLYTMRIVLETLALRLSIPHFAEEDFVSLRACLRDMDEHAKTHDIEAWNRPHSEFHRGLVAHSGARIRMLVGQLADQADRYRRLSVTQGGQAWSQVSIEHGTILAACERRDPLEAGIAIARHLARTVLTVVALVAPEHDPAPVRVALASIVSPDGPGAREALAPVDVAIEHPAADPRADVLGTAD